MTAKVWKLRNIDTGETIDTTDLKKICIDLEISPNLLTQTVTGEVADVEGWILIDEDEVDWIELM